VSGYPEETLSLLFVILILILRNALTGTRRATKYNCVTDIIGFGLVTEISPQPYAPISVTVCLDGKNKTVVMVTKNMTSLSFCGTTIVSGLTLTPQKAFLNQVKKTFQYGCLGNKDLTFLTFAFMVELLKLNHVFSHITGCCCLYNESRIKINSYKFHVAFFSSKRSETKHINTTVLPRRRFI